MAFCKFCGREIPDGSSCDCPDSQMAASPDTPAAKDSKTKNVVMAAVVVVVVVLVILLIKLLFGGGYKAPVKDFEKALNKCDGELLAEAMLTDDMMDEFGKDELEELDDMLEMLVEFAEDEYGDNVKFSIDIDDKEKLTDKEIKSVEEDYESELDDYKVEITKGYKLEIELTVKGKDKKDSDDAEITVVKIKGEGWKLSPDALYSIY